MEYWLDPAFQSVVVLLLFVLLLLHPQKLAQPRQYCAISYPVSCAGRESGNES